jgi:hypothetical protein
MKKIIWSGESPVKICNFIDEQHQYDFLYCENTYAGVMAGNAERLIRDEEDFITRHGEKISKLFRGEPYVVIKAYQKEYPKVLQTRVCMAGLIKEYTQCLGVIWYDDGVKDVKESLRDIFDQIDWTKARDFDY